MPNDTCSTCKWFVLKGRGNHENGDCHLNPVIYGVRLSSRHWCSHYTKGQQRKHLDEKETKPVELLN